MAIMISSIEVANKTGINLQDEVKKNNIPTPWEDIGTGVSTSTPLAVWLTKAEMNWTAERTKVQYTAGGGVWQDDSEVIYRSDNCQPLGIVTPRYQIVQPKEVIEFYEELVSVNGWHLDVIGSIDGGKRIWALAKTDGKFNVINKTDTVETYMLLATSYDGKMSTTGKFISVRDCSNATSALQLMDGKLAKVAIPHKSTFNPHKMKKELMIYSEATKVLQEKATLLARVHIEEKDAHNFITKSLAGQESTKSGSFSVRQNNIIKNVFNMYKGEGQGSNLVSSKGTAWGLWNAITQHIDFQVGHNTNNRIRSAWFGQGETLKLKILNELVQKAAN